jgi:SAM-dependent methyltransferase
MKPQNFSQRALVGLRAGGLRWLFGAVGNRLFPPSLAMEAEVLRTLSNQSGLEIGGPSAVFQGRGLLPVYSAAKSLDNVNFSHQTAWEHDLKDDGEFKFHPARPPGKQWIRDAVALTGIANTTYHFLLSSHCLEHVANPFRALQEWRRVTRPGGYLFLILPDPVRTFDHRRPVTTIEHLRDDFARHTGEDDQTHLSEVLALHDLKRDPWAGTPEAFRERSSRNFENRCLHQHVFDLPLMKAMLEECGWKVVTTEKARPVHLIAFAQRRD